MKKRPIKHLFDLQNETIIYNENDKKVTINISDIIIVSPISYGANGQVFRARDELDREVAVKVWFKRGSDECLIKARNETKKLSNIEVSPLVVYVHRFGISEGFPYAVMELVKGKSGKEWLKQDRPDFWLCYAAWRMIFFTLFRIYKVNILHGDPHLGNILITDDHDNLYEGFQKDKNEKFYSVKIKPKQFGLKITDFGTSTFRNQELFESRERKVLLETIKKLFKGIGDFSIIEILDTYSLPMLLDCLDACVDFWSKVRLLIDTVGKERTSIEGTHLPLIEDISCSIISRPYFIEANMIKYMYEVGLGKFLVDLIINRYNLAFFKIFHPELNRMGRHYMERRMQFNYSDWSMYFRNTCLKEETETLTYKKFTSEELREEFLHNINNDSD